MSKRKIILLPNDATLISSLRSALRISDFSYELISNKDDTIFENLLTPDVLVNDDRNPL